MRRILNWLGRRTESRPAPRLYKICHGWGHRLEWINVEQLRVSGHLIIRPREGDRMVAPMQSGRDAVFKFSKVDYCLDPADMFFADMSFMGYTDIQPELAEIPHVKQLQFSPPSPERTR